jgi:hypothetical protein
MMLKTVVDFFVERPKLLGDCVYFSIADPLGQGVLSLTLEHVSSCSHLKNMLISVR